MTVPAYPRRKPSSHFTDSKSRWFVGSSSKSTSGLRMSSFASAMRICQPPENSVVERVMSRSVKPRPNSTLRTFDSSE